MSENASPANKVVLAAGAVCWRQSSNGPQVLLIYRERYRDWSFPKGKLKDGELAAECAVREVAEETGLQVRLGRTLPTVSYLDGRGREKQVFYWAARALEVVGKPNPGEVDKVAWLAIPKARDLLTSPSDHAPLDRLERLAAAGELDTSCVLVVRHGTARPRDSWARTDADRPLIASGQRQAQSLAGLLTAWRPDFALSSPWRRCVDTLTPYKRAHGLKIRTKGGLSERGFSREPEKVTRHLLDLVDRHGASALCTHRPVLARVMAEISKRYHGENPDDVPGQDPYLAPGEILVAHVVHPRGKGPRIVEVERHLSAR